jgi:hypothetical protein
LGRSTGCGIPAAAPPLDLDAARSFFWSRYFGAPGAVLVQVTVW